MQSGCIRAKVVIFGLSCCIGQIGCVLAKLVLFGHIAYRWSKVVVSERIGGIREEWFYLGKSSWIRSNLYYLAKIGCTRVN